MHNIKRPELFRVPFFFTLLEVKRRFRRPLSLKIIDTWQGSKIKAF